MNARSHPQIRRVSYGLILLLIILSVLGVNRTPPARAQEAWTATPTATTSVGAVTQIVPTTPTPMATAIPEVTETPTPTTSYSELNQDSIEQIKSLLLKKLVDNGYLSDPAKELQTFNIIDNFPYILIGYAIIDMSNQPDYVQPSLAIAYYDGSWTVRIGDVDHEDYNVWLYDIDDNILSVDSKVLYAYLESDDVASLSYYGHYLPWQNGQSHQVTKWPASSSNIPRHSLKESGSWDWYMPIGTEIWASQSGTVKWVYENSTNPTTSSFVNQGNGWWCTTNTNANYVVVNNDDGSASLYLHLRNQGVSPNVGDRVNKADLVGYSGNTGYVCTTSPSSTAGAHLHFQVQQQSTSTWYTQSDDVIFSDSGWSSTQTNPVSGNTRSIQSNCPIYNFEGIVLWDQDNCYGSGLTVNGSTGVINLTDYSWNDRAESIYVKNGWSVRVWEDINAGLSTSCIYGSKWNLNVDGYDTNNGRSMHRDISSIQVFTNSTCTGNSTPGAASLSNPSGSIGANYIPTYTWNQVSGATWYYLWVNGPSGNVIKKWYTSAQANCNGSTCSVKHGTVLSGGAHTWWIQTWSSAGYGPWSAAKSFNTTSPMPIPGAASLVSPSGGSGWGSQPTYTWNQVNGSTWYYLWINGPSNQILYRKWYTSAEVSCNGSTCSIRPGISLPSGANRWWIQTWNPSGQGSWSSGIVFYP